MGVSGKTEFTSVPSEPFHALHVTRQSLGGFVGCVIRAEAWTFCASRFRVSAIIFVQSFAIVDFGAQASTNNRRNIQLVVCSSCDFLISAQSRAIEDSSASSVVHLR